MAAARIMNYKLLISIFLLNAPLPMRALAGPSDDELTAAFYDSKVTDAQFSTMANVSSVKETKSLLSRLYSSVPRSHFKNVGIISSFDLLPPEYGVVHAINYYVPKSYKVDGRAPVLVILHGGGASTNAYATARDVSRSYLRDFTDFAERNGVILIGPSSSLGWSYITRILMTASIDLAKAELAIDPDRIYFWGHSMGAMAITREAHWLAGIGAVFMPSAGGMPDEFRIDAYLRTYFNTRIVHMQGLSDSFPVFVDRTRAVARRMKELEAKVGWKSGYEAIFEDRGHNADMATVIAILEGKVLKARRNCYQPRLFPLVERLDAKNNRLGPDVAAYARGRYFWIETPNILNDLPRKEFDQGLGENYAAFEASVRGNRYRVKLGDPRISALRILVSSKMVDLSKPITVLVNGKVKFRGKITADAARLLEIARARKDRAFIFENKIDILLR